jgi:hypothetical protein
MRHVSIVCVLRRRMLATTILGTLVAAVAAQGMARAQTTGEVAVRTLGGPNRFSGPMVKAEDLRAMATANRTQITSVLAQAGLGHISTQVVNAFTTGYVSDTTVAPGTHFDWMALKRAGRPGVLRNVRWTGPQAFDAFQISVEAAGYHYTFVVPKVCGNFALLNRTAVVAAAPPPAPAPPPPPRAPRPAPAPPAVVQVPPPPPPAPAQVVTEHAHNWMAAGFIGSSFSTGGNLAVQTDTNDGGVTYGFQLGYVRRYIGGEFIGDFGPTFKLASLALSEHPAVNSYMFNLIGMVPTGSEERFQLYASGGLGAISMHTSLFTLAGTSTVFAGPNTTVVVLDTVNATQTKFGTDVGGGFFAYAGRWGVRGDVRYYNVSTNDANKNLTGTPAENFTQTLLSGLNYWRANLGVAYRW